MNESLLGFSSFARKKPNIGSQFLTEQTALHFPFQDPLVLVYHTCCEIIFVNSLYLPSVTLLVLCPPQTIWCSSFSAYINFRVILTFYSTYFLTLILFTEQPPFRRKKNIGWDPQNMFLMFLNFEGYTEESVKSRKSFW